MTVISKSLFQASSVDGGFAQRDSSIAVYDDGTFSISWSDESNVSGLGTPDILGQHFTSAGAAVPGGYSHLSGMYLDGPQQHGDIADLAGNILVVYQTEDMVGAHTGQNISYEIIEKDGTPVAARKGALLLGTARDHDVFQDGDETAPTVAVLGSGDFLISYVDDATGADKNIRGLFVAADGTEGAVIEIDNGSGNATAPDSATLSNGNVALVYESDAHAGDIRFAICSSSAVVASGGVTVTASAESNPHVAALDGGGFVAVWEDADGDDTGNAGIKAAIFTNAGVSAGSFSINTAGTVGIQRQPAVTALQDGGFMVAWVNAPDDTIVARRFDATGMAVEDQFVMADLDALSEPRLATLSDGRVILSVTNTDGAHDKDIYATIWDPRSPATAGDDTIDGDGSNNRIDGLAGNDVLRGLGGNDTLAGSEGNDRLEGGAGNDRMTGGAGNDTFSVDSAGDTVLEAAGGGADRVFAAVSFALAAGQEIETLQASRTNTDTSLSLTGNGMAQTIVGDAGRNILSGLGGNDTLKGSGGTDKLIGGGGKDVLTGGSGADTFYFDSKPNAKSTDKITDFRVGADRIALDASWFGGHHKTALDADQFTSNAKGEAIDASDRIIYNSSTGALLYDADGSGAKDAVVFARLATVPHGVTEGDFFIL